MSPFPTHRTVRVSSTAAAAALVLFAQVPVAAAQEAPVVCILPDVQALLKPGITVVPVKGTFTTAGTVTCQGNPAGVQPTGPGRYTSQGSFEGGCAELSGPFTFRMTFPTSTGEKSISGKGEFTGLVFTTDVASGAFQLTSLNGDCVSKASDKLGLVVEYVFA